MKRNQYFPSQTRNQYWIGSHDMMNHTMKECIHMSYVYTTTICTYTYAYGFLMLQNKEQLANKIGS